MVIGSFFTEILERSQRPWTCLNLIENDQCPVWFYFLVRQNTELKQNSFGIKLAGKNFSQTILSLKIEIGGILKMSPAEFLKNPSLSTLPYSSQNQRLSVRRVFPGN